MESDDIASLLFDSYVDLSAKEREELLRFYMGLSQIKPDTDWLKLYSWQILQRVFKAKNNKDLYLVFEFMEADLHSLVGYFCI